MQSLLESLSRGIVPFRIPAFGPLTLLVLPIPLLILRWRGKSLGYLVCFSLFFIYAWAVVVYTILDWLPMDAWDLEGIQRSRWSACINLVPRFFSGDLNLRSSQVYGNFLLGVPLGFALPFVARTTHKRVIALGLALAVGIELTQLFIGLVIYHGPYRVIDIDDVWLVFTGTCVGYGALWVLARIYKRIGWLRGARLPVWDHVHDALLSVASPGGSTQRET